MLPPPAEKRQNFFGVFLQFHIGVDTNYGASSETHTAVLEYSGQIVKITNKSLSTGVSIEKAGPKEATSGQPVRYVLSRIGNSSNVMLQLFYWRDTLPAAVRLDKVVTGTYNFPGTYKIVYKVNNTGDYRTLADSLSTSRNYSPAASPAALGLGANERVTEIMFVFGQVPGGFTSGSRNFMTDTFSPLTKTAPAPLTVLSTQGRSTVLRLRPRRLQGARNIAFSDSGRMKAASLMLAASFSGAII